MSIFAELQAGIAIKLVPATHAMARRLAADLPADTTIALHGDMGVGKTTFVQGLAQGLGVRKQVTSPAFPIYSVYHGTTHTLVHVDAYRLTDERQIEALLLEEFLASPWCLAIEWPDRIHSWLPSATLQLRLSILSDGRHHFQLQ